MAKRTYIRPSDKKQMTFATAGGPHHKIIDYVNEGYDRDPDVIPRMPSIGDYDEAAPRMYDNYTRAMDAYDKIPVAVALEKDIGKPAPFDRWREFKDFMAKTADTDLNPTSWRTMGKAGDFERPEPDFPYEPDMGIGYKLKTRGMYVPKYGNRDYARWIKENPIPGKWLLDLARLRDKPYDFDEEGFASTPYGKIHRDDAGVLSSAGGSIAGKLIRMNPNPVKVKVSVDEIGDDLPAESHETTIDPRDMSNMRGKPETQDERIRDLISSDDLLGAWSALNNDASIMHDKRIASFIKTPLGRRTYENLITKRLQERASESATESAKLGEQDFIHKEGYDVRSDKEKADNFAERHADITNSSIPSRSRTIKEIVPDESAAMSPAAKEALKSFLADTTVNSDNVNTATDLGSSMSSDELAAKAMGEMDESAKIFADMIAERIRKQRESGEGPMSPEERKAKAAEVRNANNRAREAASYEKRHKSSGSASPRGGKVKGRYENAPEPKAPKSKPKVELIKKKDKE